jgi:hypothetical protein
MARVAAWALRELGDVGRVVVVAGAVVVVVVEALLQAAAATARAIKPRETRSLRTTRG